MPSNAGHLPRLYTIVCSPHTTSSIDFTTFHALSLVDALKLQRNFFITAFKVLHDNSSNHLIYVPSMNFYALKLQEVFSTFATFIAILCT